MGWSDIVAVGAVAGVLGMILGNTKLAVSIVHDVWHYIKRRPTRTKRLEQVVGGISDMLPEMKATLDDLCGTVKGISDEMPVLRQGVSCREVDHRYVERGIEALLNGMMVVLDKTPGNGEVAEARQRIRDFASVHHR